MSGPTYVGHVRYSFACSKDGCTEIVLATLPEMIEHGWIDISTHSTPNLWLCPTHGRGYVKEDVR